MEHYNNDYSKNEDFVLWELHEIRHQINEENQGIDEINNYADKVIKKYNLKNIKKNKRKNRVYS